MKFKSGVHVILGMYDSSVNMFLFEGKKLTLVDSGCSPTPDQWVFPYLKVWGLKPELIRTLINTHAHFDHASGNSRIIKVSDAKVAAHVLGKPSIEDRNVCVEEIVSYARFVPSTNLEAVRKRFAPLSGEGTKVDIMLEDGDFIEVNDGKSLKVLHLPGHSADSIGLYDKEDGILFIGDTLQIGLKHFPYYDDFGAQINTLERLSSLKPNVLLSAHYPPLKGKDIATVVKRVKKLTEEIHEKTYKTIESSDRPLSLLEIGKGVCASFSYSFDDKTDFFTLRTIKAHVDNLISSGRVAIDKVVLSS